MVLIYLQTHHHLHGTLIFNLMTGHHTGTELNLRPHSLCIVKPKCRCQISINCLIFGHQHFWNIMNHLPLQITWTYTIQLTQHHQAMLHGKVFQYDMMVMSQKVLFLNGWHPNTMSGFMTHIPSSRIWLTVWTITITLMLPHYEFSTVMAPEYIRTLCQEIGLGKKQ